MSDPLQVIKPDTLDILDTKAPALSSTDDMPRVETKPDASNEGKPPALDAPKEEKAAPDEGKTPGESATPAGEETPASDEQAKKPAKGVQKRLDELTRQREEAERRAKAAEENLAKALEAMNRGGKQPDEKPADTPGQDEDPEPKRPTRADYADPEAWDAAVLAYADERADWTARTAVKKAESAAESKRQQETAEQAQRAMIEAHSARVEKAKTKYADFSSKAEAPDVSITIPMAQAIIAHEQGPDIQYYLGTNPDEAARISKLPVPSQLLELGMIAATLREAPKATAAPAAPAKPITAAPAPIKPKAEGTASVTKPIEEMSMEEYAAMRKAQLAAERRPGARRP